MAVRAEPVAVVVAAVQVELQNHHLRLTGDLVARRIRHRHSVVVAVQSCFVVGVERSYFVVENQIVGAVQEEDLVVHQSHRRLQVEHRNH